MKSCLNCGWACKYYGQNKTACKKYIEKSEIDWDKIEEADADCNFGCNVICR